MAEITASLVKELREMTGLGMMECKKALSETRGDLRKAEELLRIKSGAKASKVAGRIAAEGVVGAFISADARLGALVEVNCETDFVAKNEDFLSFANGVAELVAKADPRDVEVLASLVLDGAKVEQRRQSLVQKFGENISIRRFERLQTTSRLALYLHGTKIGVIVDYEGPDQVGKDLAMHVAFAKPAYLAKADVPADAVACEREILTARAKETGKPDEIVAKIVEGGVNKFLNEIALLGQPFVRDDKQSIEKMLGAHKAKVHGYRYIVVGEGIERKTNDFPAEVQAQAGLAR